MLKKKRYFFVQKDKITSLNNINYLFKRKQSTFDLKYSLSNCICVSID